MMVIKKIPRKKYRSIAGIVILIFEIPTEFIIIFSDPLISPRKAITDPENVINGKVK